MAAPAWRQRITATGPAASVTLTLPAAPLPGSLLVIVVAAQDNLNNLCTVDLTTFADPTGWAVAHAFSTPTGTGSSAGVAMFYKTATGGEQSVTLNNTGADWDELAMAYTEYTGLLNSSALDGPGGVVNQVNAPGFATGPVVAYTAGPRLIVHACVVTDGGGAVGPGFTTLLGPAVANTVVVNQSVRLYHCDAVEDATGGSSQARYLNTAVHPAVSIGYAFKPSPATGFPRRFW